MSALQLKKLQLNLMKCQTAKMELEFKVEERKEDIKRIEEHIQLQEDREAELKEEIENFQDK